MTRPSLLDRFVAKVNAVRPDECWEWTGAKLPAGYGRFGMNGYAHRFSYELLVGPIPPGLVIDHLCRNPSCVNPDHLEPVTHRENTMRGEGVAAQHARKTECPKGHPYDDENTRLKPNPLGGFRRECRACRQILDAGRKR